MRKRSKRTVRRIVAYRLNPEVTIQERAAVLALRGGWAEGSHYNVLADCRDMLMRTCVNFTAWTSCWNKQF